MYLYLSLDGEITRLGSEIDQILETSLLVASLPGGEVNEYQITKSPHFSKSLKSIR